MAFNIGTRIKHAWNAFLNRDPTVNNQYYGPSSFYRPDRPRIPGGNERSIVTAIFNRIALDVATVDIRHCKTNKEGQYLEDIKSDLNNCLTLEANLDQSAKSFRLDIVLSMLGEGCVAVVPIDTDDDPNKTDSYDILTMRTAKILEWKPYHVLVEVYNDRSGRKEEILVSKSKVAIIENPLYAVVNEPNSIAQRLMRKLSLLDVTDEKTASGKLDLIIQLPYSIRSDYKKQQAEEKRKDIEMQLSTSNSNYGVAYIDATDKVIQLNRSVENNLIKHIEYLTNMLFSQLGITQSILDGTADEQTYLNYYNQTIMPIVDAITEEFKRKFLTKTARTQGQSIMSFRDPFKGATMNTIAEATDKFTRNEVMTSNEIRQKLGMKPSKDPKADELINSNISQPQEIVERYAGKSNQTTKNNKLKEEGESQNGE